MTYAQLVRHFGSLTKAAKALDTNKQTVNYWKRAKRIPDDWQLKIHRRTGLPLDRVAQRKAAAFAAAIGMSAPAA